MKNPKVSIIIPTFNRATDLERALSSIFKQTFQDWEVLVVDNSSTDNTRAFIESLSDQRISFFEIQNHGVVALSRNVGIKNAKGVFLAFLDSDDWWRPDKLEKSVSILESKNFDLIYHDLYHVNSFNQFFHFRKEKTRNLEKPVFQDLILNGNGINNSSVVVRKSIVDEVGGLDEDPDLVAGEDFDLWIRVSRKTDRFYRIKECLGYYWVGGGNLTNPTRSWKVLQVLKSKYSSDFESLVDNEIKMPWWFHKTMMRVSASIGDFDGVKKEMKLLQKAPIRTKWKYLLLFQIWKIRRCFGLSK
ncbi:glycosyltransferase [Leptospira sp. 201903070]|uniref:Glycosyltransferase n=1 Tax=Leptospira ainlahdjerensis TaxID=2810033 RepID=A0ABS2UA96_9LEPT|nr:glycosyltransferase [Leptospira ainlahdjerensis]MBM9577296.1 glycosyltransferase [Leptospira ainlahdjerensis]